MRICEVFRSIQGECRLQGAPTVFVRFAGCDLRCTFCDTKYAQDTTGFVEMSPSAILDRISPLIPGARFACLTGGEPLLQPRSELVELISLLVERAGFTDVSIETNGSIPVDWLFGHPKRTLISLCVDYKLESSEMSRKMIWENYLQLRNQDTLKFVCDTEEDMNQVLSILRGLSHSASNPVIYVHSVGGGPSTRMASFVMNLMAEFRSRFDVRFGVQLHKLLYGDERCR